MPGKTIKIPASGGGELDCYLALPAGARQTPAVVIASAVNGVDADIQALADEFAAQGYIAAAPDLFWRTIPGPLPRGDKRNPERSQPRVEKIRTGEADFVDTLAAVRKLPQFGGRALAMGFCYGGPYGILGPARLGYDAGISCHGSQMLDFIRELEGTTRTVCLLWGDRDHQAPPPVLAAYRELTTRVKNVELHVFPGVEHGYMFPGNEKAYSPKTREFSMQRALALLAALR